VCVKRIRKMGTIVRQPGSGRPRSARIYSSGGPCAQSGGQAKKALIDQLLRFRVKLEL